MKLMFTLIIAALMAAWHPEAKAVSCGDTITGNVTLTADLHCASGWVAIYVPTGGITIRLNGHTLSGTSAIQGIAVSEASNVTILGPGRISGFWAGVNGTRADYLTVKGVNFDGVDAGVIASDTLAATVEKNGFQNVAGTAVQIHAVAGSRATLGAHAIVENSVLESGSGIQICGHANSDNLILDNDLQGIRDYGIHVYDASNDNQIESNTILKSGLAGLVIRGSRKNRISGNLIDYGYNGIAMLPQFTGFCDTGPYTDPSVRDNSIVGNSIFRQAGAITMGLGSAGKVPLVLKNRINGNKLYYNDTGLFFLEDTYANNATSNAYFGTTTPVVDLGSSNTY